MFESSQSVSQVTAILPTDRTAAVMPELLAQSGTNALSWRARSTLLQDHWLKRWFPPISTPKTMLQMLVPDSERSDEKIPGWANAKATKTGHCGRITRFSASRQ